MDTVRFDKKNTQMVAHRGLSGLECENTMTAFIAAANRSYFGIETDIHMTADGEFVLIHDNETKRVCSRNLPVEKSRFAALAALRLRDPRGREKYGDNGRRDLVIPVPEDYLSVCRRYGKTAVLELKPGMNDRTVARVVELVRKSGALPQTIFISFDWDCLLTARRLLPEQPMQFLTRDCDNALIARLAAYHFGIDVQYSALTEERVSYLHAHGVEVNCWTCDDPAAAEKLASWGVDYITTNILE